MFLNLLAGGTTLAAQVAAILRTYGTDAHVYLPGIGIINGLTAGNYLDSAGTTAATVDNPVGLVVDSGGINALQGTTANKPILRRGAVNLLTYSEDFSNAAWSKIFTASASNATTLNFPVVNDAFRQSISGAVATNNTYTFSVTLSGTGTISLRLSNTVDDSSVQQITLTSTPTRYTFTKTFNATASTFTRIDILRATGDTATTVTATKAQLQTGSVATDYVATTTAAASSPTGNYWWQFDGSNDSLALGSVPFQMADDHCVIAGAFVNNKGADQNIISASSGAFTNGAGSIYVPVSGTLSAYWFGSSYVAVTRPGSVFGTSFVATAIKIGSNGRLRYNGSQVGSPVTISDTLTSTTSIVGASGAGTTNNFTGNFYATVIIKGTVSDADLLTLERFVGRLSGVTI